jgi:uncharacterized protein YciI
MGYFVVTEERGPSWDPSRPRRGQDGWDAHAAFMDRLVDEGFVVLGGPVGDGVRVLLVMEAESERQVEARLADDPWMSMEVLRVASVEPWEILLDGRVTRGTWGE